MNLPPRLPAPNSKERVQFWSHPIPSLQQSGSGRLVTLAAQHSIPTIYPQREYIRGGGLISYGPDFADGIYRNGSLYARQDPQRRKAGRISTVVQAVKFELVINLKTAKTLGLDVPPTLLATADRLME